MRRRKKLLSGLVAGLFWVCLIGMSEATVIDFEDTAGSWGQIPSDYAGLNWVAGSSSSLNAWTYWDVPYWFEAGSGRKIAYWNLEGEAWIEFGEDVTFKGSWIDHDLTNMGNNESWWEGYKNGVKIYESEHYAAAQGRFLSVNWIGVDAVQLRYTRANQVIIDDLTYDLYNSVPEPATMFLFSMGIAGLAAIKSGRRSKK